MLAYFEKISSSINHSFYVNNLITDHFKSPLHFHPEIEIMLVVNGSGTRFVGESIESFSPGDLVLVGANTPHFWFSDKKHYKKEGPAITDAIYIQFLENFFGDTFGNLPEMKAIKDLFIRAQRGMKFLGSSHAIISNLVKKIPASESFERLNLLLQVLHYMSISKEFIYLCNQNAVYKGDQRDCDRINKVYEYVMKNFHKEINLEEVADIANFAPTAFCRYFKVRTNKTFSQFLNEIRIGHACKLLIENEKSVAEICFESGFNYFSNFNKQFKKITHLSPLEYQRKSFKLKV